MCDNGNKICMTQFYEHGILNLLKYVFYIAVDKISFYGDELQIIIFLYNL